MIKLPLFVVSMMALPAVAVLGERQVPELPEPEEKIRVVIDTDAACEIDDLYAISQVITRPDKFEIEGIVAAHWGDAGGPDGLQKSYDLILELLEVAGETGKYPVLKGSDPFQYSEQIVPSEGVDFIIERAMDASKEEPLWVISLGACTNVAMAYLKEPAIKDRVVVLWHGRTEWPVKAWNFNAYNDLKAVRVLMKSQLPLVLFDTGTYIRAPMEKTEKLLAPHGPLGEWLHEFRRRHEWFQSPTKGFFDLGDITLLLKPSLAEWETVDVPEVDWDMDYKHTKKNGKMLRVYQIQTEPTWQLFSESLKDFAQQK